MRYGNPVGREIASAGPPGPASRVDTRQCSRAVVHGLSPSGKSSLAASAGSGAKGTYSSLGATIGGGGGTNEAACLDVVLERLADNIGWPGTLNGHHFLAT